MEAVRASSMHAVTQAPNTTTTEVLFVSQSNTTSSSVVKRYIVVQETQAGSQRVFRDGHVAGLRFVDSKKERILDQSNITCFRWTSERGPGRVSVA